MCERGRKNYGGTMTSVFCRCIVQIFIFFYIQSAACNVWADGQYEVIIHPNVSDKNLSIKSLRAIFGMRLHTWSNGAMIRVFVMSDDAPLHQKFCKEKLNIFSYQLRLAWDRLVFSGTGQAPIKVNSSEEMLAKVANTPGAIGYLWKADINNDRVDVLQLQ